MEVIIDQPVHPNQGRIYTDRDILIGTFLGGPPIAGYLMASNYRVFNKEKKVGTTWVLAIAATIVVVLMSSFAGDVVPLPTFMIPLAYSWLAFYIARKTQGEDIRQHLDNGGKTYSTWRVVGLSLAAVVIYVVLMVVIVLVFDTFSFLEQ